MIDNVHGASISKVTFTGDKREFTIGAGTYVPNTGYKVDLLFYNRVDKYGNRFSTLVSFTPSKVSTEPYSVTYNPRNFMSNNSVEDRVDFRTATSYSLINNRISSYDPLIYSSGANEPTLDFDTNKSLAQFRGDIAISDGWYTLVQTDLSVDPGLNESGALGASAVGTLYILNSSYEWVIFDSLNILTDSGLGAYLTGTLYEDGNRDETNCMVIPASKAIVDNAYNSLTRSDYKLFRDKLELVVEYANTGEYFKSQLLLQSVENMLITT